LEKRNTNSHSRIKANGHHCKVKRIDNIQGNHLQGKARSRSAIKPGTRGKAKRGLPLAMEHKGGGVLQNAIGASNGRRGKMNGRGSKKAKRQLCVQLAKTANRRN